MTGDPLHSSTSHEEDRNITRLLAFEVLSRYYELSIHGKLFLLSPSSGLFISFSFSHFITLLLIGGPPSVKGRRQKYYSPVSIRGSLEILRDFYSRGSSSFYLPPQGSSSASRVARN
ncbi:hypothetical protein CEXT_276091 [Caerostris extrusa]|uniref:Maturase K n=1 Tax=Caerostris extrusa TaxID=172846 RepID=A0AAV4WSA9_CAEEX|nr:hypothetical protein CEXT_276091 [Caerostris extrusa]